MSNVEFSEEVTALLRELEERDAIDIQDGTPKERRVRCITRTVASFLYSLVLLRAPATILELGTSAGYSTIWLAHAAQRVGGRVISVESDPRKLQWAASNLQRAGLQAVVDLRYGDALSIIPAEPGPLDFVFMDHRANLYLDSFRLFYDKLSRGAAVIADGWGTVDRWHSQPSLVAYAQAVQNDRNFFTWLLPIEKGELLSIRL